MALRAGRLWNQGDRVKQSQFAKVGAIVTLRYWLQTTRSLIEETIGQVSKRRTRGSRTRKVRPLKLVTLEDRIVFSATPLVSLPIEPGIEPADGLAADATPLSADDLYSQATEGEGQTPSNRS